MWAQATAELHLANLFSIQPERPDARSLMADALERGRRLAEEHRHATRLGQIVYLLGKLEDDETEADRLIDLCVESSGNAASSCLAARAARRALAGRTDEALSLAREAMGLLGDDLGDRLEAIDDLILVAWHTLAPRAAARASWALIAAAEAATERQGDRMGQIERTGAQVNLFEMVPGFLLRDGGREDWALEAALQILDSSRARSLLEERGFSDRLPDSAEAPTRTEIQDLFRPTARAEVVATRDFGRITMSAIQRELRPDEALLVYQLAPDRDVFDRFVGGSWVLVVTRERADARRLASQRRIDGFVGALRGSWLQETGDQAPFLARSLRREVLDPATELLPPRVRRWIVVPDGSLAALPLAALVDDPERVEIEWQPSAEIWLESRRRRRTSETRSRAAPALVLAVPEPGRDRCGEAGPLAPLPGIRAETEALRRSLGRGVRVLEGRAANEVALRAVGDFRVLHLAAHARLRDARYGRSVVVLGGAASDPGPGVDGCLGEDEIAALPLDGQLVVLSTCDGAAGHVADGEGVLSLARAFLESGAAAVVAAVHPIRDRDAVELFSAFYRELAAGKRASAALATAQREIATRPGARMDSWAGVVLLGRGDVVVFPGGAPGALPLRLLAGALLLVVGVVVLLRFPA